ncbi:hypothetical protein SEA_ZOOMAN_316 [Microbacterium phage Zooman]|nr:hypothetical protein SEA_ZOOMAN_3 [Microbacterium phage Zooman]UDL16557.1 hypothetical protein SEA_ZOOMAN_316 [Microbacterium phage Zooman]
MEPKTQRELLRVANRDRLNSTEVRDLVDFSTGMLAFSPEATAPELLDIWKESYDQ